MNKTPTAANPATTTRPASAKPAPTGNNAAWDADEDDTPYGDPAKAKDAGVLESLGKAVSSPVTESEPEKDQAPADSKAGKR